jgi:putative transposase
VKQRYSQEQIIAILHEAQGTNSKVEVCRKHGVSEQTYYRWRHLYGGLASPQVQRLKELEAENARLKRLLAEQLLANEALKQVLVKRVHIRCQAVPLQFPEIIGASQRSRPGRDAHNRGGAPRPVCPGSDGGPARSAA